MKYKLVITRNAAKELQKIRQPEQKKIEAEIDALAPDPRPDGCIKLRGMEDTYRIRIGNFRVVYSVFDKVLLVEILKVADRKDVY